MNRVDRFSSISYALCMPAPHMVFRINLMPTNTQGCVGLRYGLIGMKPVDYLDVTTRMIQLRQSTVLGIASTMCLSEQIQLISTLVLKADWKVHWPHCSNVMGDSFDQI